MNILVIGGGHLGRELAEKLDLLGHEVVIIEEDAEKLKELSDDFGGLSYSFFPMDITSLKNAGIESCDAIAVVTPDDNLNIAVGQIAKDIFGITNVVSRITDPLREEFFNAHSLKTVCPTNMASESLITAIMNQHENCEIKLGVSTVGFRVREASKKELSRFLHQLTPAKNELIIGMLDSNGRFTLNIPASSTIVSEGSFIVSVTKSD